MTMADKRKALVMQCQTCGVKTSSHLKSSGVNLFEVKPFDDELAKRWQKKLESDRKAFDAESQRIEDEKWDARRKWYAQYLQSPKWFRIRSAVLIRDGNKCQGCLSETATQVHHKDYHHVGDETGWMFDLVSLCDSCHGKIHGTQNEPPF